MADLKKYEEAAALLKALGHPARLCIVHGLLEGPCNVGTIKDCLGLPQATISQHLAVLRGAGIVEGVRRGTEVQYRVKEDRVRRLVRMLLPFTPESRRRLNTGRSDQST